MYLFHLENFLAILDEAPAEIQIVGNLYKAQVLVTQYSISKHPPNDAQKKAIAHSFSFPITVIWGPLGTGKTKTIAKVVEAHLRAG